MADNNAQVTVWYLVRKRGSTPWSPCVIPLALIVGMAFFSGRHAAGEDAAEAQDAVLMPSQTVELLTPPVFSEQPTLPTGEVTIAAVGDVMVHKNQLEAARQEDGSHDFSGWFDLVAPYLQEADIAMGNLETVLVEEEKSYGGFPFFGAPVSLSTALREAGFSVLTTANNHSLDKGLEGIRTTLEHLDAAEIASAGSNGHAEALPRATLLHRNGLHIALLAYTEHLNGLEGGYANEVLDTHVARIAPERILEQVAQVDASGVDFTIVCLHWGVEEQSRPNAMQERLARELTAAGADLIVGSHPHVLQPIRYVEATASDGTPRRALVAFSLGNIVSDQRSGEKAFGGVFRVTVRKNAETGVTEIEAFDLVPTWVQRVNLGTRHAYHVLPIVDALAEYNNGYHPALDAATCATMRDGLRRMATVVGHDKLQRFPEKAMHPQELACLLREQPARCVLVWEGETLIPGQVPLPTPLMQPGAPNVVPHNWDDFSQSLTDAAVGVHAVSRLVRVELRHDAAPRIVVEPWLPQPARRASLDMACDAGWVRVRYARSTGYATDVIELDNAGGRRPLNVHEERILARNLWRGRVGNRRALWVSVDEQWARLIQDGMVVWEQPCSTAAAGTGSEMNSLQTPLGWHVIREMIGAGAEPGTVFRAKKTTGEIWTPGQVTDEDLVLTRLISLGGLEPGLNQGGRRDSFLRSIYIHGTNAEEAIGTPASHGCVRLRNDDVIDLFERVDAGTLVLVTEFGPLHGANADDAPSAH